MTQQTIALAGATGDLGGRIADALAGLGAAVRALVRHDSAPEQVERLRGRGIAVVTVDPADVAALSEALAGAACVVSALAGLRDVIVQRQGLLLQAAIRAGVPRFIASDYAIDFTRLRPGSNRNLDLRRDFHAHLDSAPIASTSILNGAFTDMLTGPMPVVLFRLHRVLYWGDPDQRLDFTTMNDTAAFTARAALDPLAPRTLRIAGDQVSARDLASIASDVTDTRFGLIRGGGLGTLATLIRLARHLAPQHGALYPPWQGMQYLHNMFEGRATLQPLDNDRYPALQWTGVHDVLAAR